MLGSAIFILNACGNSSENNNKKLIAEVNQQKLWDTDLVGMIPKNISKQDSARWAERFIEHWIRKQLILGEAEKELQGIQNEINRKVDDYKQSLIRFEFEKNYIQKKLDTKITKEEINQYFQKNQTNFALSQAIAKVWIIKIPSQADQLDSLKKLLQENTSKNAKKIKEYAKNNAIFYHLNDSTWMNAQELFINAGIWQKAQNNTETMPLNSLQEIKTEEHIIFYYLKDWKATNELAPLNFVEERIKNMILQERKTTLLKNLENEIYEKAQKDKKFTIYK